MRNPESLTCSGTFLRPRADTNKPVTVVGARQMVNNPKEAKCFNSRDVNRDAILVRVLGRISVRDPGVCCYLVSERGLPRGGGMFPHLGQGSSTLRACRDAQRSGLAGVSL